MPRVFCIDGIVVDIPSDRVTKQELKYQALMPLENEPIMAGILRDRGVDLLSPMRGDEVMDKYDGMMLEDINTETFKEVTEALQERGEVDSDASGEWP